MWAGRKLGQSFQLSFLNLYFSVCMLRCLSIKIAGMLQGKLNSKCWGLCIFWQVCISWIISFPQAFIFWLWRWFIQKGALLVLCGNWLQSSLALGTSDKLLVCEELICLWPAQLFLTPCANVRKAQVWCWQAAGMMLKLLPWFPWPAARQFLCLCRDYMKLFSICKAMWGGTFPPSTRQRSIRGSQSA